VVGQTSPWSHVDLERLESALSLSSTVLKVKELKGPRRDLPYYTVKHKLEVGQKAWKRYQALSEGVRMSYSELLQPRVDVARYCSVDLAGMFRDGDFFKGDCFYYVGNDTEAHVSFTVSFGIYFTFFSRFIFFGSGMSI
jgi:hypothetical protein